MEICIIGAGLSGLALASALRQAGRDVMVLDRRDRTGGRILSQDGFDLGPSWVWPQNRRMMALLARLGLSTFRQHTVGRLVFEAASGVIRRDLDMATMSGALRVMGGLAQVTDALTKELGGHIRLAHPVLRLTEDTHGVTLTLKDQTLRAEHVVLAMPPRLAAQLGLIVPDVPTWMAGHTKLVATYAMPFWRCEGLNGDAISHRGPLSEIHDASPDDVRHGALFGFAYPGDAQRSGFRDAAIAQLTRLFGAEAARPTAVFVKDWSKDPATATRADQSPPSSHPTYHPLPSTKRVFFAGTETAAEDGGFLEGALAAAETTYEKLGKIALIEP